MGPDPRGLALATLGAAVAGALVATTALHVSPIVGLYGGIGAALPVVLVYFVMTATDTAGA